MKFIRKHIATINKISLGVFAASWGLLVITIPVQVAAMAESHQFFSVYNAKEGCFELVAGHHENDDYEQIEELEQHDAHIFHELCCYDDYLKKVKENDFDQLSVVAFSVLQNDWNNSHHYTTVYLFEGNLPPPVTLDILRVTRLLI